MAKKIALTVDDYNGEQVMFSKPLPDLKYLNECLTYDKISGNLTWKNRPAKHFVDERAYKVWNTRYSGTVAGAIQSKGYVHIMVNKEYFEAHRLAWKLVTGEDPKGIIDHRDTIRSNNAWSNLRDSTMSQNGQNRAKNKKRSTPKKGTYVNKQGKIAAQIKLKGEVRYLGIFATAEEGHAAYMAAAREMFGEYANDGECGA